MNSRQAKDLNLPALLSILGHEPVTIRKAGTEYWYLSPFRSEKEPSFIVSEGKVIPWVWNDFGDKGGTVIDFAMRYKNYSSLSDALAWLESISGHVKKEKARRKVKSHPTLFSFNQQIGTAKPSKIFSESASATQLQFRSAGPIRNPTLLRYLMKNRGLPGQLIELYLEEILYLHRPTEKIFFAFGMQNRSGGYEIRSASDDHPFKSALNGRDITIITGNGTSPASVNLFEGMTDFLSLLAMYSVTALKGDAIILHSVTSFDKAVSFIETNKYTTINTFLDNDRVGRSTTKQFKEAFQEQLKPQNELYSGYKDLNAALMANL